VDRAAVDNTLELCSSGGYPMQTTIQKKLEMRGKSLAQNNVINIALSLPLALAGYGDLHRATGSFSGLAIVIAGGL